MKNALCILDDHIFKLRNRHQQNFYFRTPHECKLPLRRSLKIEFMMEKCMHTEFEMSSDKHFSALPDFEIFHRDHGDG